MSEDEQRPRRGRVREYVLRTAAVLIGALAVTFFFIEQTHGGEPRLEAVLIGAVFLAYGIGGPRLLERVGLGKYNE